jgi:AcrR family transcriptional regulator
LNTSAEPRIEQRSGYGSRVQLHKRDVVDAATAILDNYGIADLTMRRLGRELNVSPGALYWHFANKQQLLGAVADRILEPVDDVAADWQDRLVGICRRLRDALLSHTDGAELVSASFAAGRSEAMSRIVARLGDAAGNAGVDGAHTELAARTVVYYVLGFTADEQSRLQWDAAGAELPDEQSVLADDAGERFGFGLAVLVAGIAVTERESSVAKRR